MRIKRKSSILTMDLISTVMSHPSVRSCMAVAGITWVMMTCPVERKWGHHMQYIFSCMAVVALSVVAGSASGSDGR